MANRESHSALVDEAVKSLLRFVPVDNQNVTDGLRDIVDSLPNSKLNRLVGILLTISTPTAAKSKVGKR